MIQSNLFQSDPIQVDPIQSGVEKPRPIRIDKPWNARAPCTSGIRLKVSVSEMALIAIGRHGERSERRSGRILRERVTKKNI